MYHCPNFAFDMNLRPCALAHGAETAAWAAAVEQAVDRYAVSTESEEAAAAAVESEEAEQWWGGAG